MCEAAPEAGTGSGINDIKLATVKTSKDQEFVPVSAIAPFSGLREVRCLISPFLPSHSACSTSSLSSVGHQYKGSTSEGHKYRQGYSHDLGHVRQWRSSNCGLF